MVLTVLPVDLVEEVVIVRQEEVEIPHQQVLHKEIMEEMEHLVHQDLVELEVVEHQVLVQIVVPL